MTRLQFLTSLCAPVVAALMPKPAKKSVLEVDTLVKAEVTQQQSNHKGSPPSREGVYERHDSAFRWRPGEIIQ